VRKNKKLFIATGINEQLTKPIKIHTQKQARMMRIDKLLIAKKIPAVSISFAKTYSYKKR
jgi:hypothetical protein